MGAPLIVRDATRGDVDTVAALLQAAYGDFRTMFPPPIWDAYRREIAAVAERLTTSQLIVAVDAQSVVGTVTFYPDGRRDGHGWPPGFASLRLLAVHPTRRGAGIGPALVEECVARARKAGASHLGLHTAPFMDTATRLYQRLGFVRRPELDFDADVLYASASADAGPQRCGQGGQRADHLAGMAYALALDEPLRDGRERAT